MHNVNKRIYWLCGIKYRPERDIIDLGYRLKRNYWGNGYATEAAEATINYAFEELNLQKLYGFAHIDNIASWKVLEKCGMNFIRFDEVDNAPAKVYQITNPTNAEE